MRAREMLRKAKRFRVKPDNRVPDLSVLSPAEQDRFWELTDKLFELGADLTDQEEEELADIDERVPLIDEKDWRPLPPVPAALVNYFTGQQRVRVHGNHFPGLRLGQKGRLANLCRHYGWRDGTSPRATMTPVEEWSDDDYNEINALLAAAESR